MRHARGNIEKLARRDRTAGRIAARLRKRSATLIVWGRWPGSEARLVVQSSVWTGADQGHGRLRSRRLLVGVQRGSAPAQQVSLELGSDTQLRRVDVEIPVLRPVEAS